MEGLLGLWCPFSPMLGLTTPGISGGKPNGTDALVRQGLSVDQCQAWYTDGSYQPGMDDDVQTIPKTRSVPYGV